MRQSKKWKIVIISLALFMGESGMVLAESSGYNPAQERFPVVVVRPSVDGSDVIDGLFTQKFIIEPIGLTDRPVITFVDRQGSDMSAFVTGEEATSFIGAKIIYRFTNIPKYLTSKRRAVELYKNRTYKFETVRSDQFVKDIIDGAK